MENNTDLKEFRINQEGLLPIFQKDVYEYYLTVSKDVNEIEVEAVSENPNSKIQISGNNNLQLGENTIQIRVISPDENEEKIYSIQVTKTDNEEIANSNLEILAIENASLEPAFDSNITNYKTEVSNEIRNLNIFAVPENENAKIEIKGAYELDVGNNFVDISVTSEDGRIQKNYKIEVYRRNRQENNLYEKQQEENEEKIQEILEVQGIDENYNTEKLSLESRYYISDNNSIKILILSLILILISIILIFKIRNNKK